jgi:hypothetical protein
MTRTRQLLTLVTLLLGPLAVPSADAAGTLVFDQVSLPTNVTYFKADGRTFQQGVTAGVTGLLVRIDLFLRTDDPFELTLARGAPWWDDVPDTVLQVTPPPFGSGMIDISAAGFSVTAGEEYTIGLIGSNPNDEFVRANQGDYLGGDLYINGDLEPGRDLGFRTVVLLVPEPTTTALVAFAALTLAGLRGLASRRRGSVIVGVTNFRC